MGRKTQTILEHATILAEQIQNNPEDWEKRRDALLTMQRVVEEAGASGVFDANVWRSLKEPLKNALNDLRSTMVKEACSLLETLSMVSGNLMSGLLRDLLTMMLQLVANGNSVIATRVDSCLKHVIKHTRFPRQLKEVEFRLKDTRSKDTRVCISSYLLLMLREWPPASIDKDAAHVEAMIKVLLADASNDARADARASFAIFRQHWPKRAEKILEECDPRTAKALNLSPGNSGAGGDDVVSSTERVIHSTSPSRSHSLPDSRATSNQGRRAASSAQGHGASGSALEADGAKRASLTRRGSLTGASPGRGVGGAKSGRQASNSSTPSAKTGVARPKTRSIPPATPIRSKGSSPSVPVSGSRHVKRSTGEKSTPYSLHGTATSGISGSNAVLAEASTVSHSNVDKREETALVPGDKVRLKGAAERQATVRYVGNTQFATGTWIGVELLENEEPSGNNNGSVNGVPYFRCPPARGIFLRPDMVQLEDGTELLGGESRGHEFSLQEAVNDVDAAVARFAANARGKSMEGSGAAVAAEGGDIDDDDDDYLRRAGAQLLRCHKLFVKAMIDSMTDEMNTIPGLERLLDSDSPVSNERLCFYRDMLECAMEDKITVVSTLRAQVHNIQTAYPDVFNIAPLPSTCPCTPVEGGEGVDGNFGEGKDERAHSVGATFKNGVDRRLFGPDEEAAANQEQQSTSLSTSTSPASSAPSTSSLPSASASVCTHESRSVVNAGDVSPHVIDGDTATPPASSSPKDRSVLTPNTQSILSPVDLNGAEDSTSENSGINKETQTKEIQNAGCGTHEALWTD